MTLFFDRPSKKALIQIVTTLLVAISRFDTGNWLHILFMALLGASGGHLFASQSKTDKNATFKMACGALVGALLGGIILLGANQPLNKITLWIIYGVTISLAHRWALGGALAGVIYISYFLYDLGDADSVTQNDLFAGIIVLFQRTIGVDSGQLVGSIIYGAAMGAFLGALLALFFRDHIRQPLRK